MRFDPLVRCSGVNCKSIIDIERGPLCVICRRRKARSPVNARFPAVCECRQPLVDHRDRDEAGDARCLRCGRDAADRQAA